MSARADTLRDHTGQHLAVHALLGRDLPAWVRVGADTTRTPFTLTWVEPLPWHRDRVAHHHGWDTAHTLFTTAGALTDTAAWQALTLIGAHLPAWDIAQPDTRTDTRAVLRVECAPTFTGWGLPWADVPALVAPAVDALARLTEPCATLTGGVYLFDALARHTTT